MNSGKIIAVACHKGGVGKSTTVLNMANVLANEGNRVLIVDLDPQSNLSMIYTTSESAVAVVPIDQLLMMVADFIELPSKDKYICAAGKVSIITCTRELTTTEINLRNEAGGERVLAELLDPLRADYDYIIVDTCSSSGYLTTNALAACDSVIIPVAPELWSVTGLAGLLNSIDRLKRRINPGICVEGVLLTMCDPQTNLFRDVKQNLEEYCSGRVKIFGTIIPRTTKVGQANSCCVAVTEYAPRSKAAKAYADFVKEVIDNECNYKKPVTA